MLLSRNRPRPGKSDASDMTNHPRYSPPPQQPGHRPVSDQRGGPRISGRTGRAAQPAAAATTGATRPSSSRRRTGTPYDPVPAVAAPAGRPLPPMRPQKRSRAGALTAGAVAVAVVSAGIGGGVALLAQPGRAPVADGCVPGAAPSVPAASAARRHASSRSRPRWCPAWSSWRPISAGVRRGLGHHPVLRRPDPDQQPRRRGGQPGTARRRPEARRPQRSGGPGS